MLTPDCASDPGIAALCFCNVKAQNAETLSWDLGVASHLVFSRLVTLELELVLTVALLVPLSQLRHWSCCKDPCSRTRCQQKYSLSVTWTCSGQHRG